MPGDGAQPHGADAALGLEDGFLETFQKGALHRQMLDYKRECERIAANAETLERDYRDNMLRLVATEECWKQLVDELRTTLGDAYSLDTMVDEDQDTAMSNGHDDTEQPIADPALSKRLRETRALVAGLTKRPSSTAAGPDLSTRYQVLSAELIESRAAHTLLQAVLQRTQDELSATLESLKQLERKVVRDRSGTVQQLEKRTHGENKEDADRKPDISAANGAAVASSPAPGPSPAKPAAVKQEGGGGGAGIDEETRDVLEGSSGLTRTEIEELRTAADARLKEASELRAEKLALLHEVDTLKIQRAEGGEAYFAHTPEHRALTAQVRQLRDDAEAATALHARVSAELDALRGEQGKLRAALAHEAAEHDGEAARKLGAAQQDGARLRAERDARAAEVQELRTKEGEKCRHVEQMRVLAEARQTRIDTLVSQTYRWRMRLAALEGDAALVEELASAAANSTAAQAAAPAPAQSVPPSTSVSSASDTAASAISPPSTSPSQPLPEEALLHNTKARLEEAERLTARYRGELATLASLSADDPELNIAEVLVQNEANALKHLEDARSELEKLRALLSDDGQPDGQKLLQRAETAEAEAKKLEAKVKTAEMSTTMLISEVTRLSETWEVLNRQNQNKVFDLAQYDARLELAARDRGRANQKYFASEREKETLVAQLTIADKMKVVQKTAIERQKEEAVALRARLADAELDLAKLRADLAKGEQAVLEAKREQTRSETRLEGAEKAAQEANRLLAEKTTLAETENTGKRRAEEQITKLERDVDKWRKKANTATAAANGQGRYVETDAKEVSEENILLKRMLKCSSCQQRFKSHAITRCFHLFCKECIDARLETRQRKCPSCSIGFGQADVQQIYF